MPKSYPNQDADIPPRRLRAHREALVAFRDAYNAYIEATERGGTGDAVKVRRQVSAAIRAASNAARLAGTDLAIYPPPAVGGPVLRGLANVAFAHETVHGVIGLHGPPAWQRVLDMTETGIAQLEDRERRVRRRRRNPLYWGDRFLRAVLGFPVYLLSILVGEPVERFAQSPLARAVRIVELPLAIASVYLGGKAVGWW